MRSTMRSRQKDCFPCDFNAIQGAFESGDPIEQARAINDNFKRAKEWMVGEPDRVDLAIEEADTLSAVSPIAYSTGEKKISHEAVGTTSEYKSTGKALAIVNLTPTGHMKVPVSGDWAEIPVVPTVPQIATATADYDPSVDTPTVAATLPDSTAITVILFYRGTRIGAPGSYSGALSNGCEFPNVRSGQKFTVVKLGAAWYCTGPHDAALGTIKEMWYDGGAVGPPSVPGWAGLGACDERFLVGKSTAAPFDVAGAVGGSNAEHGHAIAAHAHALNDPDGGGPGWHRHGATHGHGVSNAVPVASGPDESVVPATAGIDQFLGDTGMVEIVVQNAALSPATASHVPKYGVVYRLVRVL